MDIAASADAFAPISEPLSKMSETKHFLVTAVLIAILMGATLLPFIR